MSLTPARPPKVWCTAQKSAVNTMRKAEKNSAESLLLLDNDLYSYFDLDARPSGDLSDPTEASLERARQRGAVPAVKTILKTIMRVGLLRGQRISFLDAGAEKLREPEGMDEEFALRSLYSCGRFNSASEKFAREIFGACVQYVKTGAMTADATLLPGVSAFAEWINKEGARIKQIAPILLGPDYAAPADFILDHPEHGECILNLRTQRTKNGRFDFFAGMGTRLAAAADARARKTIRVPRIINFCISMNEPARVQTKLWSKSEQSRHSAVFQASKLIWKRKNNFEPQKQTAA